MGFTTGFLSGTTLTLGLTYLTLAAHRRIRLHQASLLRQQSDILNNVVDPEPERPILARAAQAREEHAGVLETAKDRWNAQLTAEVRQLQETDWAEVRARVERGAVLAWGRARDALKRAGES